MSSLTILATLVIHNSKTDSNGNREWAFTFTDHVTGKSVSAKCHNGSNAKQIPSAMGYDADAVMVHEDEMPIRQFNSFVKGFGYAGCVRNDLAKYIEQKLFQVKA